MNVNIKTPVTSESWKLSLKYNSGQWLSMKALFNTLTHSTRCKWRGVTTENGRGGPLNNFLVSTLRGNKCLVYSNTTKLLCQTGRFFFLKNFLLFLIIMPTFSCSICKHGFSDYGENEMLGSCFGNRLCLGWKCIDNYSACIFLGMQEKHV